MTYGNPNNLPEDYLTTTYRFIPDVRKDGQQ
jgi:hypothetical protein